MWKPHVPWCVVVLSLVCTAPQIAKAGSEPSGDRATFRPPRDRALVCFYRETAFQANWFHYRIADGSDTIGSVSAGTFFTYLATPGEHAFGVRLIAGSRTTFTLKGGRTYYLRADDAYEVLNERPRLSLVPATEGAAVVFSLDETRRRSRLAGEQLPLPRPHHGLLSY